MLPPNTGLLEPPGAFHSGSLAPLPTSESLATLPADLPALPGMPWASGGPLRPKALSAGPEAMSLVKALRRRLPLALGIGSALGALLMAAVWFLAPRNQEVHAYLLVNRWQEEVVKSSEHFREQVNDFMLYKQTVASLVQNPYVLVSALKKPGVNSLSIVLGEADPVRWIRESIKVTPSEGEVMDISLSCDRPAEGADLLNAVVDALVEETSTKRKQLALDSVKKLEATKSKIETELSKHKSRLTGMTKELGTADPMVAQQKYSLMINDLRDQRQLQRMLSAELGKREFESLQLKMQVEVLSGGGPSVSEYAVETVLNADPTIRMNMERLGYEEQMLQTMISVLPEHKQDSPQVDGQRLRIANLRDAIESRKAELRPEAMRMAPVAPGGTDVRILAAHLAAAEEQKDMLKAQLDEATRTADEAFKKAASFEGMSADLEHQKSLINTTSDSLKTVEQQLFRARAEVDAQARVAVLDKAKPPQSSDLKLRLGMTFFTGLLGLCAGLAGIAFWEFQARRVSDSADISEGLGLRVVGSVPTYFVSKRAKKGQDRNAVESLVAESINSIRTALLYGMGHDEQRVVMVTSATHNEAKTSLATQLAASIARAGRRTLLIDGDLRSPSAHQFFDLSLDPGLADVLRSDADLNEVVRPTRANGLWMMTAGHSDPEAIESLARPMVGEAFDRLREEFDFVIIDAGPVLPTADTLLMGQHVDAVLLSVLRDHSQMPKVYEAYERLKAVGIKVMGSVVSGVATNAHERARPVPAMTAA